jgi:hypothetical protein
MNFLIQARKTMYGESLIPEYDFGYSVIEAIEYANWWEREKVHDYHLVKREELNDIAFINRHTQIPIGSVEFCLDYYNRVGILNIKPLNIPEELWPLVKRPVTIDYCKNINGHWFLKSTSFIKDSANGEVWFNGDGGEDKKYFLTRWVDDVVSEWRLFIYKKSILGLKCYSGDDWILPDKRYCESVTIAYDSPAKEAYTLDVMVYKDRMGGYSTDIVELHDFFGCGLYGFTHNKLLNMIVAAHKNILEQHIKRS